MNIAKYLPEYTYDDLLIIKLLALPGLNIGHCRRIFIRMIKPQAMAWLKTGFTNSGLVSRFSAWNSDGSRSQIRQKMWAAPQPFKIDLRKELFVRC